MEVQRKDHEILGMLGLVLTITALRCRRFYCTDIMGSARLTIDGWGLRDSLTHPSTSHCGSPLFDGDLHGGTDVSRAG